MAKGAKNRKKENVNHKKRNRNGFTDLEEMDDEIDAFHKGRDVIPLDIDGDIGDFDEDNEQPVFDFEGIHDEDDDDDDMDDETQLSGLAAKIARQQKYLRAKTGGVEDDMHDDSEEEEEKKALWGRSKSMYYSADNVDYELQSSDEELPAEEEAEVLRLQREKAKLFSMEDFGLEDTERDDSDGEPTIEEILVKGKATQKSLAEKEAEDAIDITVEEVQKDINALSREEQMDVVYSSAPELVGLLSELNHALEELEGKVNPLLGKVKRGEHTRKGGIHYLELKKALLLSYCQAIVFYLLLKSEGQPVRDHPVIARLVEIKNLLDKTKQLDVNIPSKIEEILENDTGTGIGATLESENAALRSDSFTEGQTPSLITDEIQNAAQHIETDKLVNLDSPKGYDSKGGKRKHQEDQISAQSKAMLKVRDALEEKLKQKGIFSSLEKKPDKARKRFSLPVYGQLETMDDFDDEVQDARDLSNGHARSSKLSDLVASKGNKLKVVSGDDDLPKRDDIGERRRKHELRVLAGAGLNKSADEEDAYMVEDDGDGESEDEFYKQVKNDRAAKLAAKAEIYSRTSTAPSLQETLVDGKRQINYQIEKNRGLTRARNKLTKNPRKKYKLKHQKAMVRRKGQVREIRRPTGPYGGETTGINAGISRSIRFKN